MVSMRQGINIRTLITFFFYTPRSQPSLTMPACGPFPHYAVGQDE